ncbi:hypothetical protein [Undibacterium sp. TJN19]|uniref:hypothetical protein n=1 Tax=Undibacterium sp. TJN19 TaxID=3413055 RepID=UPI003BF16DC3
MHDYPVWIDHFIARFASASLLQKTEILQSFTQLDQRLPVQAQELVYQTALHAKLDTSPDVTDHTNQELFSTAIIALSKATDIRSQAIALLSDCLAHPLWFIRGNAALSLAMLGVSDEAIISRIADLLFDKAGNDWHVFESALQALEILGGRAQGELPKVLRLVSFYLHDTDGGGWNDTGIYLADCLAAIGDNSSAVISMLCQIIAKRRSSAYQACIALGMLGTTEEQATQAIASYLCSDDMPADEARKAHELIDTLISVAGEKHAIVGQCLTHLLQSPFPDVAHIARQRLSS